MNNDPHDIDIEVEVIPPTGKSSPRPSSGMPAGASARAGREAQRFDDPFIALVSRLMDTVFVIPGTNIRFGLDPILGLVPGLGDTLTAAVSVVLILQSARYGVPKVVLARMAMNVIANTAVGSIPVFGDAFSVFFKSNAKNYELLRRHAGGVRKATRGDWVFVWGVIAVIVILLVLVVAGAVSLFSLLFQAKQ